MSRAEAISTTHVFVITGMHRSGTSLAASLLQAGGVHVGRDLIDGDEGNLPGYFENIDFHHFHCAVLAELGYPEAGWLTDGTLTVPEHRLPQARALIAKSADACAETGGRWGWKDPRTTLFLEFWRTLLPQAHFVFLYRAPWEVADSIFRRASGTDLQFFADPKQVLDVWRHYNQQILDFARRYPSDALLVNSETLTHDPEALVRAINGRWGATLALTHAGIVKPELLKKPAAANARRELVRLARPECIAIYEQLEALATLPGDRIPAGETPVATPLNGDADAAFRRWYDGAQIARLGVALDETPGGTESELQKRDAALTIQQTMLFAMEAALRKAITPRDLATKLREWRQPHIWQHDALIEVPRVHGNSMKSRLAFIMPGVFNPGTYMIEFDVTPGSLAGLVEFRFTWARGAQTPNGTCGVTADGHGQCRIHLTQGAALCCVSLDAAFDPKQLLRFSIRQMTGT